MSLVGRWFGGYRSALRSRDLRLLLASQVVSTTGTWAFNVALMAFLFAETGSLGWIAAATLARFLPVLLLSPYAGVIAERTERIRLMITIDLLCVVWQAGLVLVAATGGSPLIALVLTALTAATSVAYEPAVAATIPAVVDEDDLVAANALNGSIENVCIITGPAIGAALLALGDPAVAFAINAVSFVVAAALVVRMHVRSRPVDVTEGGAAGPLAQLRVGLRAILGHPAARTLVAFAVLVQFVYGTDTVLFVGVSEQLLGTGAEGFGYLLAGLGLGCVLAAPAVDRIAARPRLAPIILAGVAGFCLPTALLTVITSPGLAFALEIVRGGATIVVEVLAVTALQRSVPGDQIARVFGLYTALLVGAIALGSLITPPLVDAAGLETTLLLAAFVPVGLGVLGLRALLAIDRATADRLALLEPRIVVFERLGIFAAARRPVLERLAAEATTVEFGPGATIVAEGDAADALYVLVEGEVDVTAIGEAGAERHIRVMTGPAYFGELGVLEGIPRTATVTARTPCRCERIAGDVLLAALNDAAPAAGLLETARARLAITHPSRAVTYEPPEPAATA